MADKRAYFKLDVGYMSNPKVLAVLDESTDAILLHIASIAYAAQHLTDGVVPVKALLRMTGAKESDAALLVTAGLWVDGPEPGKAEVHDYLEHQRSATEVKGATDKAKRAASARWDAPTDASSNAVSNALSMPDALPDASEFAMPREIGEREREREESGTADAAPTRLDVERICQELADAIEANGSKRPTITKAWRDEARRMLDLDKRDESEVMKAIDWCQRGTTDKAVFWRSNVLSMPKLRTKFDQMRLQAMAESNGNVRSIGRDSRLPATEGPDDWMRRRL